MFEPVAESRSAWGDWLLRVGVGVCFLFIGWAKFSAGGEWVKIFNQIGMGQWFRYFTGVVEMLGGSLVLVPRFAAAGYGLLAVTMAGAALAQIFLPGHDFFAVIPGGLFVFLAGCCMSRRNA